MNFAQIIILFFFLFIICLLFILNSLENYEGISKEEQDRITEQTKVNTANMLNKIFLEIQNHELNNHKAFNDAHDSFWVFNRLVNNKVTGVNITHYNLGNEPINDSGPPEYEKCNREGGEYADWTINWNYVKEKEKKLLEDNCNHRTGGVCLTSLINWPILEQIWNEHRSQCNYISTNWSKIKKIYEAVIGDKCGKDAIFWPITNKCVCKNGKIYNIDSKTCSCPPNMIYNSEYGCICPGNMVPDKDPSNRTDSDIKCIPPNDKPVKNGNYYVPIGWDFWWPNDIPPITSDLDITPHIRIERNRMSESRHKIAYNELDVLNHYSPDEEVIQKINTTLKTLTNTSLLSLHPREYIEYLQTKKIISDRKEEVFFAVKKLSIFLKEQNPSRIPFIGPPRENDYRYFNTLYKCDPIHSGVKPYKFVDEIHSQIDPYLSQKTVVNKSFIGPSCLSTRECKVGQIPNPTHYTDGPGCVTGPACKGNMKRRGWPYFDCVCDLHDYNENGTCRLPKEKEEDIVDYKDNKLIRDWNTGISWTRYIKNGIFKKSKKESYVL